ncbi:hypothetical protein [Burkholderia anthina]|uniref:hypothetical protein n=1 Tax=Burkholderia anthina TaxID=179879 RepID=UPI001AA07973|nr:hypothetical protein [Burkholderia anthina]QTD93782.1 hypothetical protein J4G50_23365 [Burkholderia anthina]
MVARHADSFGSTVHSSHVAHRASRTNAAAGSPDSDRVIAVAAQPVGARDRDDRRVRIGARRSTPLAAATFSINDSAEHGARCAEHLCKCEHDVAFVAAPAWFHIPLRDGSEKQGDRLAHGYRLERGGDARSIPSSTESPDRDRRMPARRYRQHNTNRGATPHPN